jgi:hypothetical protein
MPGWNLADERGASCSAAAFVHPSFRNACPAEAEAARALCPFLSGGLFSRSVDPIDDQS